MVSKLPSAAEQLRQQQAVATERIELREELRASPAGQRRSSLPRCTRLVTQHQRLTREADAAKQVLHHQRREQEDRWAFLATRHRTDEEPSTGAFPYNP